MTNSANLHPQLARDCLVLGRFPLSILLLMNDANYPWFILVPDRPTVSEIFQLSELDQQQLIRESSYLSQQLQGVFKADKLNIAALGNIVPQLHLHHIVRYRDDPAWPAPIWGAHPPQAYSAQALQDLIAKLRTALTEDFTFSADAANE